MPERDAFEQWVADEVAALSGAVSGPPLTPGAMAENAAFRSFLAGVIGNPMTPTQPYATRTCAMLDTAPTMRHAKPQKRRLDSRRVARRAAV